HPYPSPVSTLSLHDALPIYGDDHGDERVVGGGGLVDGEPGEEDRALGERPAEDHRRDREGRRVARRLQPPAPGERQSGHTRGQRDRKSTRLNSSHVAISYAV